MIMEGCSALIPAHHGNHAMRQTQCALLRMQGQQALYWVMFDVTTDESPYKGSPS